MAQEVRKMIAEGKDPRFVTREETRKIDERFIDDLIANECVKVEDILDLVDQILKYTHGKTAFELAKEFKNQN